MFGFSSLYTGLAGVGIGISLLSGAFLTGVRYEYKIDQVASLKAKIAGQEADLKAAEAAAKQSADDTATLALENKAAQEKIDALTIELGKDPTACKFNNADLDRLYGVTKK